MKEKQSVHVNRWVGVVALGISLYILWWLRQVLLILLVAIVLSVALNRLVQRLQQWGIQRPVAIALSVLIFLIVLIGGSALVIPLLIEQLQRLIEIAPQVMTEMQTSLERFQTRTTDPWANDVQLLQLLQQQTQRLTQRVFDDVFIWVSDLLAVILNLIFVLVLTIMLLTNPHQYRQPFIRLFPAFYRPRIDQVLTQCETDLVGWLTGTAITMLFVSVVSGLGLWALRLPLVLTCALWAGFTEIIPNIGYIVGMLLPLSITVLDAPWKALPVVLLYFLIQQLESYVIIPWVMKEHAALPPAVTLLAQIVFATFFGVLGLFLALPLMIVTKVVLRELLVKDVMDRWTAHSP